ncbi:hypothetical protein MHL31_06960 [Lutibacter sp. A80]|uniref:hypothetical protein n=1 Tax=Lutibacter sp. A80 TaxID=2918453 RepID=UPI001F056A84|nr:hypothetical protein [Lutibacter sp. A80]UMB61926.1 hypothetical protein MHL31_06960 [Lutibacter sp. A80]
MKKIKYILIFMISFSFLTSCFDDETGLELNDEGNNVAGFTNTSENVSKIASGEEYLIDLKMKISGPTTLDLTSDITVTFAAAEGSTAIEGVHYRIDNATTTLTKANNYLGYAQIVMLTDGIQAPLDGPSPILNLMATTTNGENKVVASGKAVTVTLNYACDSNLDGTYTETQEYYRLGAFQSSSTRTVTFTKTGVGEYRTSEVGHWTQADLGYTPGFTFYDVCGTISIPGQNLVDTYSNWVQGVSGASSVDPITGNIYMEYTIVVPPETTDRIYYVTYVKQ